jgi:hypothetical protein
VQRYIHNPKIPKNPSRIRKLYARSSIKTSDLFQFLKLAPEIPIEQLESAALSEGRTQEHKYSRPRVLSSLREEEGGRGSGICTTLNFSSK